ncbi:MAG: hypothetical protein ACJ76D_08485 [Solirubrobacterales bacterium]
MPAAARFPLTGCALLAILLLAGCGGGADAAGGAAVRPGPTTTVATKGQRQQGGRPQPALGGACQSRLGSFVASMDSLRRRLAAGLTYDQYVAEVRGIGSTYGNIPIERVEIGCLTTVGTPAERAFNRYIEAANGWGKCVSEAGCSSASIEPVLQRRWRVASHFLSAADDGLNAGAP